MKSGVPQRVSLTSDIFLIHVNDVFDGLNSYGNIFVDNANIMKSCKYVMKAAENDRKIWVSYIKMELGLIK